MLTVPYSIFKSSTNDQFQATLLFMCICTQLTKKLTFGQHCLEISFIGSKDSDLEAFSHNPTDDGIAASADQPTALLNI